MTASQDEPHGLGNNPNLDEKLGAMVMAGFAGQSITGSEPVAADLRGRHLGGVVLYDSVFGGAPRNIVSPGQTRAMNAALQECAAANLFIATDREGQHTTALQDADAFPRWVSHHRLGTIGDPAMTYEYASYTAAALRSVGINWNFAPCVDVDLNPDNPIIGRYHRSFSPDPTVVVTMAESIIRAHRENGVLTTLKHFPGHGSSAEDSHLGFVDVTHTWSDRELEPFQLLIEHGLADTIMTAHIFNANIDPDLPATLSYRTLTAMLRERFRWDGVIITDDLDMKAISANYGFEEAIALAVNAGNDILLYSNFGGDCVPRAIAALKAFVADGTISEAQIDQSYRRIRTLKSRIA